MTLDVVDKAMLARWQSYFENTHWINNPTIADLEARNQIQENGPVVNQTEESVYPMFTLRRVGIPVYLKENNTSALQMGERLHQEEQYKTFSKFLLRYQLDVFSTERENFDELLVEVQENLHRYPFVVVETGERSFGRHNFTLDLEDIQDLTDMESFHQKSQVYRAAVIYTTEVLIVRRFEHLRAEHFEINIVVKEADE